MRNAGAILMAIGAAVALFAFTMDTTVYSSGTYIGGSYVGGGSTHNLGLMQKQMMVLHTGLAAFLAGTFLLGMATRVPRDIPDENPSPMTDWDLEERQEVRRRALIVLAVVALIAVALIAITALAGQSAEDANAMGVENAAAGKLLGGM